MKNVCQHNYSNTSLRTGTLQILPFDNPSAATVISHRQNLFAASTGKPTFATAIAYNGPQNRVVGYHLQPIFLLHNYRLD